MILPVLKEVGVHFLLMKPFLDNFHPVSYFTFLGMVVEKVTGAQLLMALKEVDYLDHFQLSFRLGYRIEAITLVDDLWKWHNCPCSPRQFSISLIMVCFWTGSRNWQWEALFSSFLQCHF